MFKDVDDLKLELELFDIDCRIKEKKCQIREVDYEIQECRRILDIMKEG